MTKLALYLILCALWFCQGIALSPSMKYDFNSSLIPNDVYNMFWTIDDKSIIIEVHVKTLGYVGFGVSRHGGMKGADIVIGWVKDGQAFFQDRYSTIEAEPKIDESQDWKLLQGREEGLYTILKFTRTLTNCDKEDIDITDETMRIIFAYHPDDPQGTTGLPYHGTNRGTKSLILISHLKPEAYRLPSDAVPLDFNVENIVVPANRTTYYCKAMKIPPLAKKHHVIMIEPIIQNAQSNMVHHMILYTCRENFDVDANDGRQGVCDDIKEMRGICYSFLFLWAKGTNQTYLPTETGIPIGEGSGMKIFRLEIHYNNPQKLSGVVDSSGIRLWVTPTLRTYDAGMLTTGTNVTTEVIPPKYNRLVLTAHCPGSCLTAGMKETPEGISIFAVALHAHLLGVKLRLRHFRNGKELAPVAEDPYYDFSFQYFKTLKDPVVIKPGDDLLTECIYNTQGRENVTWGGHSTHNEMCLIFILYYPKMSKLKTCMSYIMPADFLKYTGAEVISNSLRDADDILINGKRYTGKGWRQVVESTNWTSAKKREQFQKAINVTVARKVSICDAFPWVVSFVGPFEIKEPYVEADRCIGSD